MIIQADAEHIPLANESVDLVFGSPPYCDARTYGINAQRECVEWVEWMLDVVTECLRVCRGAVLFVAAGVTRKRTYWPACEGLMYEWFKRGGSAYRPHFWHKVGIPGSGGDQWSRADVEYVMCFKRSDKLPWSDNTAMGHKPKWAPGGGCSNRLSDGSRANQPSRRRHTKAKANGEMEVQNYTVPRLANPGNLVKVTVGGGHLGSKLAHVNEAPFPEKLAEWFIRSWCPPNGTVLDPFSGSGTTIAVAQQIGRRGIGTDIRFSQGELGTRRLDGNQLHLPLSKGEPI